MAESGKIITVGQLQRDYDAGKSISKTDFLRLVDDVAKHLTEKEDMYNMLHAVGDDPVKGEIQDGLEQVLTPEEYNKVRAVFRLATSEWFQQ